MARLTLPLKFVDEANANSCIEASGLFPIGARAVPGPLGRWLIVIEARNVEPLLRHLRTTRPDLVWTVSEEAAP